MPHLPLDSLPGAERVDVAVAGGGIAGLCASYRLMTRAPHLTCVLLEASDRLGGKVLTETIERPEGRFILEAGPDAFLAQKPWARQLAEEIGLGNRLVPINQVPQPVSVLKNGRPVSLPDGVSLLAPTKLRPFLRSPLLSARGKARTALDLVISAKSDDADESLADFVRRRLGPDALDWIAEPLMAGIYNADPEHLSLLATFPNFRKVEREHRSLIRGLRTLAQTEPGKPRPPAFLTLQGGMKEFTDALAARVSGIARCNTVVKSIDRTHDGAHVLALAGRRPIVAKTLVMALPAMEAARLLEQIAPQSAEGLSQLRTISAGSVSLAYRTDDVRNPLPGYGLVIPRREERPINAITVASKKFAGRAPEGWQLLRVFFGGARSRATMFLEDDRLLQVVREELGDLLGIEAPPAFHRISRWPSGSPQYDVGHLDRIAEIERGLPPGVYIAGGAFHGVGLPDIVRAATAVAERVAALTPNPSPNPGRGEPFDERHLRPRVPPLPELGEGARG
jgi:oxygen-dependent protoporphyrinogen oxidase